MKFISQPPEPFGAMYCDKCDKEITEGYQVDERKGLAHIRTYKCSECHGQKDKTE